MIMEHEYSILLILMFLKIVMQTQVKHVFLYVQVLA